MTIMTIMKLKVLKFLKDIKIHPVLLSVLRFFASPKEYWQVRADLVETERSLAFIKNRKFHGDRKKAVLIAPASGSIYEAKIFAMLATALKEKGYRPVV